MIVAQRQIARTRRQRAGMIDAGRSTLKPGKKKKGSISLDELIAGHDEEADSGKQQ